MRVRGPDEVWVSGPSGRYTPSTLPGVRTRPAWHKAIGVAQIALGLGIVLVNFLDYSAHILPGGHLEVYFVVGVLIAACSLWWFDALDAEPSPDDVRRAFDRERRHR